MFFPFNVWSYFLACESVEALQLGEDLGEEKCVTVEEKHAGTETVDDE